MVMRCHRIVLPMAARMKRRLKIDSPNSRMLDGKVDDLADLVLVHSALDCRNNGDVQANLGKPIQCPKLLLQNVGFSAKNAIGLGIKAVELEIEGLAALH